MGWPRQRMRWDCSRIASDFKRRLRALPARGEKKIEWEEVCLPQHFACVKNRLEWLSHPHIGIGDV
jgi:hypothetical protein